MRSRSIRVWLALALAFALPWSGVAFARPGSTDSQDTLKAAGSSIESVVSDDELPGKPLPSFTVTPDAVYEALSSLDQVDVFSVYLFEGDKFGLTLNTDPSLEASVALLGPDPLTLQDAPVAAAEADAAFPEYTVPSGQAGYYAVVVTNAGGEGGYDLMPSWSAGPALDSPDWASDVPGDELPGSSVTGSVAPDDMDDVWWIDLERGQTLTVEWKTGLGSSAQLWLATPDATSIDGGPHVVNPSDPDRKYWLPGETLTYPVEESGRYYLDVYASSGDGGPYTLDISVADGFGEFPDAPDWAPGINAPVSPVIGGLDGESDWADTWMFYAEEGEEISVLANATTDSLDMWLMEYYDEDDEWYLVKSATRTGFGKDALSVRAPYTGWFQVFVYAEEKCEYELTYEVGPTDNYLPGQMASSPVEGSLDRSTDRRDYVTADLEAGDLVTVTLDSSATLDADLFVFEPGAEGHEEYTLKSDKFDQSESIVFRAERSGTYSFCAQAAAGAGDYVLSWDVVKPAGDDNVPGTKLEFEDLVEGSLTELTDTVDVYRVTLEAGHKYQFVAAGPDLSPGLMLFSPSASSVWGTDPIASSWLDFGMNVLNVVAEESGDHYLVLKSDATLDYELEALDAGLAEANDTRQSATDLGSGVNTGNLSESDWVDWYKVSVGDGEKLAVKLMPEEDADVSVVMYDEWDFEYGMYGDYTEDGTRVRIVPPGAGTYYIKVETSGNGGDYNLQYVKTPTTADDFHPGVEAVASPVLDTVSELGDWEDKHQVWLQGGMLYAFRAAASAPGADLAISITDPWDEEVLTSDEEGAVEDVLFMPYYSGFYTVAVTSNALGVTDTEYSLSWSSALGSGPDDDFPGVPLQGQKPVLGNTGSVSGDLDFQTDNGDIYRFALDSGQKLEATLEFADGEFVMETYDSEATRFDDWWDISEATESGSQVIALSQDEGTSKTYYYLRVHSERGSGPYKLSWRVTPADDEIPGLPVTASTIKDRLDEVIDRDDYMNWYAMEGQTIRLGLTGAKGTNFDLLLYNEEDEPIFISSGGTSTESITYAVKEDGMYTARVRTRSGSGDYTLTRSSKFEPTLTLSTKSASRISYNRRVPINGTLKLKGVPVEEMPVSLYSSTDNKTWKRSGTTYTNWDGKFSFGRNITQKTYFKVVLEGDADWKRTSTSAISFTPYASLSKPSKPSAAFRNRAFAVTGTLKPGHKAGSTAVKVECWQLVSGKWVKRKTVSAKLSDISGGSKYKASVSLPYRGTWKLRAVHADSNHSTTYSAYTTTFKVK